VKKQGTRTPANADQVIHRDLKLRKGLKFTEEKDKSEFQVPAPTSPRANPPSVPEEKKKKGKASSSISSMFICEKSPASAALPTS